MDLSLDLVLTIAALVCFIVAAAGIGTGRINLIALGLAFWVATALV